MEPPPPKPPSYQWHNLIPTAKQREFLEAKELEVLYGGAVGGGKSYALLMWALEGVDLPEYSCLILRKNYTDLTQPGCLVPEFHKLLDDSPARWNGLLRQWTFPSGATIKFGYAKSDTDIPAIRGAAYHRICFDELGEFPCPDPYLFAFSRVGRTKLPIPHGVRATCNFDGPGFLWIEDRFFKKPDPSRRFIFATMEDNPFLPVEQYDQMLKQLEPWRYARLRHGDRTAKQTGLVFPDFDSIVIDGTDPGGELYVGIDWGYADPTVMLFARRVRDELHIFDCVYERELRFDLIKSRLMKNGQFAMAWGDASRADLNQSLGIVSHETNSMTLSESIEMVNWQIKNRKLFVYRNRATSDLVSEAAAYRWVSSDKLAGSDHAMDALRYLVYGFFVNRSRTFETIKIDKPKTRKPNIWQ